MAGTRISSASTFFSKWVFLLVWLAIGSQALFAPMHGSGIQAYLPYMILAGGTCVWWFTCFDLADHVLDMGEYLQVRRGFKTDQIPVKSIISAKYSSATNPVRLTLELDHASRFGSKIVFLPVHTGHGLFSRNPLADELIGRANAFKSKRAA